MIFSIIAEIIGKRLDRLRKADNFKERKIAIYQAIFWGICGIISLIMYIPPGITVVQITSAIIVFFLIIYFAIRTLKYFKIL